jgi:flagellar biosynthesis/type III secretory pathway protein FliH
MMELTEQAFQKALESAYQSGQEAGVESERNRIANLVANTAFDAQSGFTPGLLSKAVMVVSRRIFGELNV